MIRLISAISLTLISVSIASAQAVDKAGPDKKAHTSQQGGMGLFLPADIKWVEGPPSLRPGAKMCILEGNPAGEGMFTMRLWFPDGYEIAPHWHSQIEHVTVISGVLNFGMGDKLDKAVARAMMAGSFGYWPVGMKHFGWTTGETVLQLHGMGPWTITYVNPSDDPRNRK